jgi:YgiT-type zinc finger domain-containing protein
MGAANDPDVKCRLCGAAFRATTADLLFKLTDRTIVILKHLPVVQCDGCREYSIADNVFARVEELLADVNTSAELEVIPFAI